MVKRKNERRGLSHILVRQIKYFLEVLMDLNKEVIKQYIDKHFPLINILSSFCPTFLMGGATRDLMLGLEPKDLDFVCLDTYGMIDNFVLKYNLNWRRNKFGGYKIYYHDIKIDLWSTKDLFASIEYNIDGLFYDVANDYFLSFGFFDAIEHGIVKLNENNNTTNIERQNNRKEKLEEFLSILKQRKIEEGYIRKRKKDI